MRSVVHILFGWLALAVGLAALVHHAQNTPEDRLRPVRLLTYPLDADTPLRFQVEAEARVVRLMSWQSAPSEWPSDPRVTDSYCVEATLETADGKARTRWTRWIGSRRSIGALADHPSLPAAWLPSRDQPVSDDRQTLLKLPEDRRADDVLEVRRCDPVADDQLLLVVHASTDRNAAVQARMVRTEESASESRALVRASDRDWLDLPEAWRANLVQERWARLAALETGSPVATTQVHTSFERASWRSAIDHGIPVPPGGALVYNLEGNTELHYEWLEQDGSLVELPAFPTRVVRGGVTGPDLPPTDDSSDTEDRQVRSVHIGLPPELLRPLRLRAWTVGGGIDRAWGDPPRAPIDPETDRQWVSPDLRNVELARALPKDAARPLRFDVDGERERLRFRFIVPLEPRLPGLDTDAASTRAGPTVRVQALDADGVLLEETAHVLQPQPSVFERYTQVDTPASAAASLPIDIFYDPPTGAAALSIDASAPVDVQLKVRAGLKGLKDTPWAGYDTDTTAGARRRFVPLLRSQWRVRAPTEPEVLLRTDRMPRVDLQVRLEPLDDTAASEEAVAGPWHALPLTFYGKADASRFPLELMAELDSDGRANAGARVRLSQRTARVEVPASGRLTLEYVCLPERLGQPMTLRVDGEAHTFTPRTTSGRVILHDLPSGRHEARFDPPPGRPLSSSELWLARVDSGWPLWNLRRVRALRPGQELRIAPIPPGAGHVRLYVYGASDLARLQWSIELPRDAPAESLDVDDLSADVALRPSSASGLLLTQGASPRSRARAVTIPLPDALPAGARLHVSVANTYGPVYLRGLATWPSPRSESVRLWAMDTPEGTP